MEILDRGVRPPADFTAQLAARGLKLRPLAALAKIDYQRLYRGARLTIAEAERLQSVLRVHGVDLSIVDVAAVPA